MLAVCEGDNEHFEFHKINNLKFSKKILCHEVSYMANELTFLRTSTSPSVVLVTFGVWSSSLMVFSGDISGVRTAFSTLFTGKENILAKDRGNSYSQ
jgi:hypothetical protein